MYSFLRQLLSTLRPIFFFPQFQLSSSASPRATLILSTQFFFSTFFYIMQDFSLLPKYLYAGSFGSLSECFFFFLSFSLSSVFNTLSFYLMLSFARLTLCLFLSLLQFVLFLLFISLFALLLLTFPFACFCF